MPTFNYECGDCGEEYRDIQKSVDSVTECPYCGYHNTASVPSGGATVVYETGDKHRGTQVKKNIKKELKARMSNQHDKYEVQEKIDKYGMNEAKRNGWLKRVKKI